LSTSSAILLLLSSEIPNAFLAPDLPLTENYRALKLFDISVVALNIVLATNKYCPRAAL
jgi:hypothetical protein